MCCLPLVTAPLSFSRSAALPPFPCLPPPLSMPPKSQTGPKHCHWTITDSAQMASKLLCFLSCVCIINVVVHLPKRKKNTKKNKCDAPLATKLTVHVTGPLLLPPLSRRAYGNDKHGVLFCFFHLFIFFQFFLFFSLIMSTVQWQRQRSRCSGDSFLACVAPFSADKGRL